VLNTGAGYKNTNPQNYEEFKEISKNSNLVDGITGELIGAVSTNSLVNAGNSSQYNYKFDTIDKIKPY
jgi:hypothetical protein